VHQLRGSQAEKQDPPSPAATPRGAYPRLFFWCVVLISGLLNVWARRNDLSPDSISYIELGSATVRGGLHQIVNAYWSPLYPFLLSLVFRCFHPPVQWEFTLAHLLNLALYIVSFVSFELFFERVDSGTGSRGRICREVSAGFATNDMDLGMRLLSLGQLLLAGAGVGNAGPVRCRACVFGDRTVVSHPARAGQLVCVRGIWSIARTRLLSESRDVSLIVRFLV